MSDKEYREFLEYLFERHVRPHMGRVRRRLHRHMEDEYGYHVEQAERAARILRFIEATAQDDDGAYETLTPRALESAVSNTRSVLNFSYRIAEETGFLEVLECYFQEIAEGLEPQHLPPIDAEVLRSLGAENVEVELRVMVFAAKRIAAARARLRNSNEDSIKREIEHALERLDHDQKAFAVWRKEKEESPEPPPKKTRRWFKGLGQIGQGSAVTIADIALAAGGLHLPVSPETHTWGAIASVTAGVGTIINGIGDLRNE